jgi:hypothetical protein
VRSPYRTAVHFQSSCLLHNRLGSYLSTFHAERCYIKPRNQLLVRSTSSSSFDSVPPGRPCLSLMCLQQHLGVLLSRNCDLGNRISFRLSFACHPSDEIPGRHVHLTVHSPCTSVLPPCISMDSSPQSMPPRPPISLIFTVASSSSLECVVQMAPNSPEITGDKVSQDGAAGVRLRSFLSDHGAARSTHAQYRVSRLRNRHPRSVIILVHRREHCDVQFHFSYFQCNSIPQ